MANVILDRIKNQFNEDLNNITDQDDLYKLKIKYFGRQGLINLAFKQLIDLPINQRKQIGEKLNLLKKELLQQYTAVAKTTETTPISIINYTIPGKSYPHGTLHPVTYAIEEIKEIFMKLGFTRRSYPEIEWEFFAFDSLNMPPDHPARDDFEAAFIDSPSHHQFGRMVLSPHTSLGQVREMWRLTKKKKMKNPPPIRMINIAKCYRPNWDATHTPMFHQFEGLCIDKNINITHLKGALDFFVKSYFGENRQIRLRPFHFRFTEPSFEVDVSCEICHGSGAVYNNKCRVCKAGWLELGGAGMVHPNVLKIGNYNPELYSGWAFGFGIERVIMMKYKIEDIRYYYSGDIRFLDQF